MRRFSLGTCILAVVAFAVLVPQFTFAAPDEPFRWYGLGGEMTSEADNPRRWLGRIGVTELVGVEMIFGMAHQSSDCTNPCNPACAHTCYGTRLDLGAGIIYDVAPAAALTPYFAARMVLNLRSEDSPRHHHDDTAATFETACGAEYVLMRRLGLSGELNLSLHTDPGEIRTSTRVRAYFYF